jgi:small-conductance mechanosensitive channel
MSLFRALLLSSFVIAALGGGARVHAQTPAPADAEAATAPVTLDGAELFRVRGVTSFPAEQRAAQIAERIRAVAADRSVSAASIRIDERPGLHRILAGDRLIMAVLDADASLEDVSRNELALAYEQRVRQAIDDYRRARSPAGLWRSTTRTAIATLSLLVGIAALVFFWRFVDRKLMHFVRKRVRSVGIQSFEVVRAEQIHAALRNVFMGVRALVLLAVVLVYAGYVLSLWPWTHGLSGSVTGFVLGPLNTLGAGFVANIPRLVFLAVLYVLVRLTLRLIRLFFQAVEGGSVALPGFERAWAIPTYNLVRIAVVALGLIVAYPYIPGSQSDAFKGLSIFVGIVFSLGSSSAISNLIAGYMLIYRRAFKIGDRVKIGDAVGYVIETRLQVTHLRSVKNEEIIVPNSEILSGEVLNYSSYARERGLLLYTEVGIGYEVPWRQVEAMLLTAAARTPALGTTPEPFVLVKRLADFAVTYELNVPCDDPAKIPQLYTALHHNVLDVFNEHGVQIMTPAYEGDPPEPKVVPPKDWYAAPAAPPQL